MAENESIDPNNLPIKGSGSKKGWIIRFFHSFSRDILTHARSGQFRVENVSTTSKYSSKMHDFEHIQLKKIKIFGTF